MQCHAVPLQLSVAVTQCPRVTRTGHEQHRTALSLNVISEHRKATQQDKAQGEVSHTQNAVLGI